MHLTLSPSSAAAEVKIGQKKFKFHFFKTLKNEWYHVKVQPKRFHLSSHIKRFRSRTQKLELHTKQIVPRESTAEEVSFEW